MTAPSGGARARSDRHMLRLTASQDAAGDGWISLHLHHTHPFIGFHIERLVACGARKRSRTEIAVFGGAGGAAEESGLLVTAGHAFVHGVFGVCLSPSCTPIKPLAASSQSILLTTLSAAAKAGTACDLRVP